MIKNVSFSSKEAILHIESSSNKIDEILSDEFTFHYIPDVKKVSSDLKADVELFEDNSIEKPVALGYPISRFREDISARDITTVGEYLLERYRQENNGYYTLSSACASLDQRAVVFFGGATNLGKTTSMLELVQNYGFEFFSDEKTLLDLENRSIVGGSRSVAIRKKILKERMGSENEFYNLNSPCRDKNAYLFIYPHLDHGLEKPISYQLSELDFYWLLLRELSQEIRGTTRLVKDFSYMLPPLDTDELANKRTKNARQFTAEIPCFYFQGSKTQTAQFVRSFYKI